MYVYMYMYIFIYTLKFRVIMYIATLCQTYLSKSPEFWPIPKYK